MARLARLAPGLALLLLAAAVLPPDELYGGQRVRNTRPQGVNARTVRAQPVRPPAPPRPVERVRRVEIEPGLVAARGDGPEPWLEATPRKGEGMLAFAKRICGSAEAAGKLADATGEQRMLVGVRYKVPYSLLAAELQQRVLRALFPGDELEATGWNHRVDLQAIAGGESLWTVADWFTGNGENFRQLREANRMADDQLSPGQSLWIPAGLLRPALRQALPRGQAGTAGAPLTYGTDEDGEYAVYRLQPGEALYSSVVVRFTGRMYAEDVNAVAVDIAKRSGIEDVTDIPIGYQVKIPFDLLQPEFLPANDPRRNEYEASIVDSAQFSNEVSSQGLEGITVVLDAGHGGNDVGASMGGVWESLYVYDIMVRVKMLLEGRTLARVVPTTRDGSTHAIRDLDVLPFSRGHQVLTTPPYGIGDTRVGVNLRWYLANSHYRKVSAASDPNKVVFVSLHADSLHPSLRGAMIYVPGAALTAGKSSQSGSVYLARAEVREQQEVEFSWRERVESEGLSRQMASRTIEAFRARGLPVHPFKPVRERIIRGRSQFVPAVLRYNAIPAKMLVEVCNLANEEDRRLIQTRAYRQQVAESVVEGLLRYYGQGGAPAPGGSTVVAKAK